jgi:hypothetical protein
MGGVGWHNTATDEVIYASTPEGVPDNYVYVAPDEEVGDEYDTVTSPQGATYRSPQPVGDDSADDGGFNEADAKDFVSSNEVGELDDISDSSKWDDPPGTVESLEAGDEIAIMNPRTFQFESAVVRDAFSDDGVAEVLTDSQSNVSISAADVVGVWNEAGGELARISAADLRDQVTQVGSIDDIIDAVDAPDFFTDELQERFDGAELQDPDQFVDDLRELIDENDGDFRIGLNDTLPQLRNALAEQGAFPQDKTNPYDIDVQSGGDVNVAFDDVIDNDFATDYDRAIALDNLVQERTGRDDIEVINADTKSQRSIVQTIEFADESGILDNLERGIERESNTSKRGQSYGWYSGGKITLKDNVNFERLEALEGSTSVSETPGEVLLHELGHANHDESRGGLPPGVVNDLEIDGDLVEDEVSGYAKTNENEFVAEVFLGRLKGEDYSDEILDYYEESIGPDLPPGVEGALNTDALTDSEAERAEATNQDDEEFTTFSECTEVNSDKSDPSAYCAVIFGFDMDQDDDTEQELLTDGGQPNELDDREQIIQEVKEGAPDDLATPWLEEAIAIAVEAYEDAEK